MGDNYSTTICSHIRTFYLIIAGEPIVYWPFDSAILGETALLVNIRSNTGDDCHYDIVNLSNGESRRLFRDHALNANLRICNSDDEKQFSVEEFRDLLN